MVPMDESFKDKLAKMLRAKYTHIDPAFHSCSSDSKTNLPKCTSIHSTPPTLLEILASSWTNILYFFWLNYISIQRLLYNTITFVNFAVSGLTSICQLLVPLLPLSSTSNLIAVIFLSRLQQIQNSLARTVMKAPKSCDITPILYMLASLAEDHWTHRIHAPLIYLQSSHKSQIRNLHNMLPS